MKIYKKHFMKIYSIRELQTPKKTKTKTKA